MNKADSRAKADRLSAIVANSLDTQAKTQDLARQAYQSRTQFHRLFRTVVEETPGAMRRRLLLERAAYQLAHTGMSVTDVAQNTMQCSIGLFQPLQHRLWGALRFGRAVDIHIGSGQRGGPNFFSEDNVF